MSRTIKYILTILLIGAAALWILTVYRSCERQKKLDNTELDNNTTGTEDADDLDDLYVDEDEDDSSTGESDTDANPYEETDTNDDTEEEGTGTGENNASGGTFADGEADINGEYLVVAGAFISKNNAESHIRKLSKQGFDAERRIFLGSDYHSVIIGNFDSEGAARTVARKLGKEAYVHKKRYLKKK